MWSLPLTELMKEFLKVMPSLIGVKSISNIKHPIPIQAMIMAAIKTDFNEENCLISITRRAEIMAVVETAAAIRPLPQTCWPAIQAVTVILVRQLLLGRNGRSIKRPKYELTEAV